MKHFLTALLFSLLLQLRAADSANIVVSLTDHGLSAATRRAVMLTPVSPNQRSHGTNLFTRDPRALITDAGGVCVFTNSIWGKYRLDVFGVRGSPGVSYSLELGTNHSGSVSAAALKTNPDTLPPDPGTNYYTMAQVDALLAATGSGLTTSNLNLANPAGDVAIIANGSDFSGSLTFDGASGDWTIAGGEGRVHATEFIGSLNMSHLTGRDIQMTPSATDDLRFIGEGGISMLTLHVASDIDAAAEFHNWVIAPQFRGALDDLGQGVTIGGVTYTVWPGTGGLTTNRSVTIPGGTTNTLRFTNGILMNITSP